MRSMMVWLGVSLWILVGSTVARAASIQSYDRVIDLGPRDYHSNSYYPSMGPNGEILDFPPQVGGDYVLGAIYDSEPPDPGYPARKIENTLTRVGSDVNLLPLVLQDRLVYLSHKTLDGHVIGNVVQAGGPNTYFFAPESNRLVSLKSLPGTTSAATAYAMNGLDQIVGIQDEKAILFATPESEPVELAALLPQVTGWRFSYASGINDQGQIVGRGYNPMGDYSTFLLQPTATPEPSVLMMAGVLGTLWMGRTWRQRSRSRHSA